jgi:hypothetical protein
MPNDNIKRVLDKAGNAGSGDSYESIVYEGYGPNGIAVIVETMTDSRNRTAGNVRHHFDKYGGKLGASGFSGNPGKDRKNPGASLSGGVYRFREKGGRRKRKTNPSPASGGL